MTDILVKEIDDREIWNGFLLSHTRGHVLQSYEWGELSTFLGGKVYRLGAFEEGKLVATMQMVVASVPLPLPRMRPNWLYCARGPTFERPNRAVLERLLLYIQHFIARQERAIVLRVEPDIADNDEDRDLDEYLALYHRAGFQSNPNSVHARRSWILDIQPSLERLYAHFSETCQHSISLARQRGVTVREASNEGDFNRYYTLLKQTSEREGFFLHDKAYHQEMYHRFAETGNAVLFIAEYTGKMIAAKFLIRFGNCCWDMFSASSPIADELKAPYLLQYQSINWAKEHNCTLFDFRAISEGMDATESESRDDAFKQAFGGFARQHMPTQDYVYQPLLYKPWRKLVELRRDEQRHRERQAEGLRVPLAEDVLEEIEPAHKKGN
jgi:peptidoglycan pentaglycine glycine transferase (the first glycine)